MVEAVDDMLSRVIIHRAARPSVSMSGSPPTRGFVSTFFSNGVSYEEVLNVTIIYASLTDEKVRKQIADMKKKEHGIRLIRGHLKDGHKTFVKEK